MPAPSTQPDTAKQKDKPAIPQLTPEEEQLRGKWNRLLDMVRRGRLDTLKTFWEREGAALGGINAPFPEWTDEKGGTLLQVATRFGQEEVIRWLLEDLSADPTLDVPSRTGASTAVAEESAGEESDTDAPRPPRGGRRTAYDLARTKAVRNIFRRCAAAHPEWWDWLGTENGARVPSILNVEMEEGRDEKKKARRKGLKDKVKEREAREKTASPPPVPSPAVEEPTRKPKEVVGNGPRKLGGSSGGVESVAGLTPEMRAKIERERRARAAEARMKLLGGGR